MASISETLRRFQFPAFLTGFLFALVTSALTPLSPGDQLKTISSNGTALCPDGWFLASGSSDDLQQTDRKLCLRVNEQKLSWERAKQECRKSRGFLIKLNTSVAVDNVGLSDYLKSRGLDSVWTGMHHKQGILVWDELQPHMVKAYYGKAKKYGWSKRGWKFNYDSFKRSTDTCGRFEMKDSDSSEMSKEETVQRARRSVLNSPLNVLPFQQSMRNMNKQRPRNDNDEVPPSRSPTEDRRMENSQARQQESNTDNGGEISIVGERTSASKIRISKPPRLSPKKVTIGPIPSTDLSNIEDVDDYYLSGRVSSHQPNTTTSSTIGVSENKTTTPKNTTDKSVTSLPGFTTPQTTVFPQTSTSVDDLLRRIMQQSADISPVNDVGGSMDLGSDPELYDATGNSPFQQSKNPQPVFELARLSESQSGSTDTNDEVMSLSVKTTALPYNNGSGTNRSASKTDSIRTIEGNATSPTATPTPLAQKPSSRRFNDSLDSLTRSSSESVEVTSSTKVPTSFVNSVKTMDPTPDTDDYQNQNSPPVSNFKALYTNSSQAVQSLDTLDSTPDIDGPQSQLPILTSKYKAINSTSLYKTFASSPKMTNTRDSSLDTDDIHSKYLLSASTNTTLRITSLPGVPSSLDTVDLTPDTDDPQGKTSLTSSTKRIPDKTPDVSMSLVNSNDTLDSNTDTDDSLISTYLSTSKKQITDKASIVSTAAKNTAGVLDSASNTNDSHSINHLSTSTHKISDTTTNVSTSLVTVNDTLDSTPDKDDSHQKTSPSIPTNQQPENTSKQLTSRVNTNNTMNSSLDKRSSEAKNANASSKHETPDKTFKISATLAIVNETLNSTQVTEYSQINPLGNSMSITSKSVSNEIKSNINQVLSGKSNTTTVSPSTAGKDSLSKDSQKLFAHFQSLVTPKSVTERVNSAVVKIVSKRSTTNFPSVKIGSSGVNAEEALKSNVTSEGFIDPASNIWHATNMTSSALNVTSLLSSTNPVASSQLSVLPAGSLRRSELSSTNVLATADFSTVNNMSSATSVTQTPTSMNMTNQIATNVPAEIEISTTTETAPSTDASILSSVNLKPEATISTNRAPETIISTNTTTGVLSNTTIEFSTSTDSKIKVPALTDAAIDIPVSRSATLESSALTTAANALDSSINTTIEITTSKIRNKEVVSSVLETTSDPVSNVSPTAARTVDSYQEIATPNSVKYDSNTTTPPLFLTTAPTTTTDTTARSNDQTTSTDSRNNTGQDLPKHDSREAHSGVNSSSDSKPDNSQEVVDRLGNSSAVSAEVFDNPTNGSAASHEVVDTPSNDSFTSVGAFKRPANSPVKSVEVFDSSANPSTASPLGIDKDLNSSHVSNGNIRDRQSSFVKNAGKATEATTYNANSTVTPFGNIDSSPFDSVHGKEVDASGGSSMITDESLNSKQQKPPSDSVSLTPCQEREASVCATEAIETLTLVGHCDRNWFGHRLLDRCYKPVEFTLKAIEARQSCLHYSASLATVDTGFYGNITAIILSYFTPGSRVWVDASLNMDISEDGQCAALEDGQLFNVDCNLRLPFICQKDAHVYVPFLEDRLQENSSVIFIQNMTSFQPQTLWCPLRMSAFDDVVLWFKDGRPIIDQDDDDQTSYRHPNGDMPNRLDIDLSVLERIGEGGPRIPKPAMLQGVYWCEIWRRDPFNRVVSPRILLKFTDVITLYGHITTEPTNHVTAAIFNRMGKVTGLPALMERRLATMNKNITHFMRGVLPVVRDIISFVKNTNPVTGRTDFTTYICIAAGNLNSQARGNLVDLYLSAFYDALVHSQTELRTEWNLTLPVRQAVSVAMADMCPQALLFDKSTGLSATFPSTVVNNMASSRDQCNGVPTGNAFCKGDLQIGAYWDNWRVVTSCFKPWIPQSGNYASGNSGNSQQANEPIKDTEATDPGKESEKPPKTDLLELNEVDVDENNIENVTDRLVNVLDDTDDLTAVDIESIAQVVDHIVSVNKPPSQISDKLVKAANKVLDAPETELKKAELQSNAPSRILADLETFGEKVDIGLDPRVRFVTPNVAMELWNLENSREVVIGFGATETVSWAAPLSEPRIQTIKDRVWAEQHLPTFDVAIQLPESLVRNSVQYSDAPLRLTMFIYRKTGLFVQQQVPDSSRGTVNSAIISASLGGQKVKGLEDKIRLVFKPFQEPGNKHKSTQCVFWDAEVKSGAKWSTSGCVYNGSVNGREVCLCDHLTNFAILTDFYGDERPISRDHETALTVLTIIGLIMSIIGLVITIISFLAFKKLRQGRAQQTLFNMAVALLCFQTTFLAGIKQTSITPVCLTVAVLLHYFILVSFAWMLIEAVLQYLTFVKVLGTYISRYTLKTVVPAWGVPLVPVIAVLAVDHKLYLGRINYCWMNLQAFYYAFALPVGIIIVFNIVMFSIIIISLATKPKGLRSNQTNSSARKTSFKAAVTIFVLLGLTWLFGYLAIEDARLPFQYAFTILSSLQGFFIFILMVARRKQVRDQWEMICCIKWKRKQKKQKKLSPTLSNSTSYGSSNNSTPSYSNNTYTNDSIFLSSSTGSAGSAGSTGLRRQISLNV